MTAIDMMNRTMPYLPVVNLLAGTFCMYLAIQTGIQIAIGIALASCLFTLGILIHINVVEDRIIAVIDENRKDVK